MEYFSSVYDVIAATIVFWLGLVVSVFVGRSFGITTIESLVSYCWHTIFSLIFCWYVVTFGGDAVGYFQDGISWDGDVGFGTAAVRMISALLVSGFELSILGSFLVFNILGQIGLLAFWGSLRVATFNRVILIRCLATVIVFLPSVSFWSSAIGKDSISFMATGLALWSSLNLKRRGLLMFFSITIMMVVRPHIAGVMVLSLVIAIIFDSHVPIVKKIVFSFVTLTVIAVLIPFSLRYAGVGDVVSVEGVSRYIESRQSYNNEGGGGVDLTSMSLPSQLFTYLFRPMLFEVSGFFELAAAIDNLILIVVFVVGGYGVLRNRITGIGENRVFMWAYASASWLVLALTTANLGIALRQKWMFLPMLIFLLLSVAGKRRNHTGNTNSLDVPSSPVAASSSKAP